MSCKSKNHNVKRSYIWQVFCRGDGISEPSSLPDPVFFLFKKVIMQIKCEDEPLENLIKHIRIVYLNINNQIKEWTAEKPNNHHLLK